MTTPRDGGSLDGRKVEVIDTNDTVLAILVYPDGTVRFQTNQTDEGVAATLQTLTDSVLAKISRKGES